MAVQRGKRTTTVRDRRTLERRLPGAARRRPPRRRPPRPRTPRRGPTAPEATTPKSDEQKPVADAPESDRSLFRVGTSVVDISPDKPMVLGGYGANYNVTEGVRDPLQVRAFFVGHGKKAVTFVSVDAQGWFAGLPDAERRRRRRRRAP